MLLSSRCVSVCVLLSLLLMGFTNNFSPDCICEDKLSKKRCFALAHRIVVDYFLVTLRLTDEMDKDAIAVEWF